MSRTRQSPRRQKSTDERLAELRENQRRDEARIRSREEWTDEAKREALAKSHAWHAEKHEKIVAEDKAQRAARKEQLEKKIFSPTSQNRASFRQAVRQASKVDGEPALRNLYEQRLATSDSDLQQAAVYVSAQRGYRGIIQDYASRRPEIGEALTEYSSPEINPSERELFRERLFRPAPMKPPEARRNAYDI